MNVTSIQYTVDIKRSCYDVININPKAVLMQTQITIQRIRYTVDQPKPARDQQRC